MSSELRSKFKSELREFDLKRGDRMGVGVSGGVDSVVLLNLLSEEASRLGIWLVICHVEHGLRGRSSIEDMEFVKGLGEKYGIPVFCHQIADPKGSIEGNLQSALRKKRYAFFEEVILKESLSHFALAHHLDDQIETLVFKLLRKGRLLSFRGIPKRRRPYVRPLLLFTKKELLFYAESKKLSWREDASNASNVYARNEIRNRILPGLMAQDPEFKERLLSVSRKVQFLEEKTFQGLKEKVNVEWKFNGVEINRRELNQLSPLELECLFFYLTRTISSSREILKPHLEALVFLSRSESGGEWTGPGELVAMASCGILRISKASTLFYPTFPEFELQCSPEETVSWGGWEVSVQEGRGGAFLLKNDSKAEWWIPLLKESGEERGKIFIRSYLEGDKHPSGTSVKSRYIKEKLPRFRRSFHPLFLDEKGRLFATLFSKNRKRSEDFVKKGLFLKVSYHAAHKNSFSFDFSTLS